MTGGLTTTRVVSTHRLRRWFIVFNVAAVMVCMATGALLARDLLVGTWLSVMGARWLGRGWLNSDPWLGVPYGRDLVLGVLCVVAATQTPLVAQALEQACLWLLMSLGDTAVALTAICCELLHRALAPSHA